MRGEVGSGLVTVVRRRGKASATVSRALLVARMWGHMFESNLVQACRVKGRIEVGRVLPRLTSRDTRASTLTKRQELFRKAQECHEANDNRYPSDVV